MTTLFVPNPKSFFRECRELMHPSPHSPKMPINCSKEPDEGHKKVTEHSVRRALSAAWWGLLESTPTSGLWIGLPFWTSHVAPAPHARELSGAKGWLVNVKKLRS